MCRKSSFLLRAGSPHGVMWRKSSFRLLAARRGRMCAAGWQPARRDVAKEFVSSVGWQPADALCAEKVLCVCGLAARRGLICAGKARFVCGLAARRGVMCRKSSFCLQAGSPQRPCVPENLLSSGGWQPARRDVAKEFVSSADWQPAEALCVGKALFVCRAGSPQRHYTGWQPAEALYVPEKLVSSAGWQPARRDVAKEFASSAGWQPAEALCAGKVLFFCGLAARTA